MQVISQTNDCKRVFRLESLPGLDKCPEENNDAVKF